ncbi:MAG: hypothetical protein AAFQ67_08750, partial [Pseudomonadota bacterium]
MSRLMPVGVFLVVVVFLAIGLTRDPSVIPTEMIDRDMPAFELPELRACRDQSSRSGSHSDRGSDQLRERPRRLRKR